ncbi:MAG: BACON domain-containing carbohydrate-binding protein, partial [Verrucomicrobiota bacterium]
MKNLNRLAMVFILLLAPAAWAQTYSLGATNLVEGPAAGSDSVVLGATNSWTATANDAWLHLSAGYQSGSVSTNVIFTFDANSGATRMGTMTIAGQTVTITQAGSTYVPITNTTTLVSSGLSSPIGMAVDGAGNVYIADIGSNLIKVWTAANSNITTLVSSGLSLPYGVAVDGAGNVYIADTYNNAIKVWKAADSNVTTLVSSGLSSPRGVAVDSAGNIYIADTDNNAIKKWTATNGTVTPLVSSGLFRPYSVAVDGAGNVYIADTYNNAIKMWTAANATVSTLVSSGLFRPSGVAVDGAGNVCIADTFNNAIKMWMAANGTVSTLVSSGLSNPSGVAMDGVGNVYIVDRYNSAIKERPRAFVDTAAKVETSSAGSDALLVVFPVTANLTGPFTPISDSSWLTITGVTNGVVSFAFTANNNPAIRIAFITLLGQSIAVIQLRPLNFSYSSLGTTNLLEGSLAGSDSVMLVAGGSWTATANATWLHLSAANQSGTSSTNVIFTFDANPGATRTG